MSDVREWGEQGLISARTRNALLNARIETIEELIKWPAQDLLLIPNFGRKSLNEITEVLAGANLRLKQPKREISQWEKMAAQRLRDFGWTVTPPE